jgi:hypothetical protein
VTSPFPPEADSPSRPLRLSRWVAAVCVGVIVAAAAIAVGSHFERWLSVYSPFGSVTMPASWILLAQMAPGLALNAFLQGVAERTRPRPRSVLVCGVIHLLASSVLACLFVFAFWALYAHVDLDPMVYELPWRARAKGVAMSALMWTFAVFYPVQFTLIPMIGLVIAARVRSRPGGAVAEG